MSFFATLAAHVISEENFLQTCRSKRAQHTSPAALQPGFSA